VIRDAVRAGTSSATRDSYFALVPSADGDVIRLGDPSFGQLATSPQVAQECYPANVSYLTD
jgi:hypothetical protein